MTHKLIPLGFSFDSHFNWGPHRGGLSSLYPFNWPNNPISLIFSPHIPKVILSSYPQIPRIYLKLPISLKINWPYPHTPENKLAISSYPQIFSCSSDPHISKIDLKLPMSLKINWQYPHIPKTPMGSLYCLLRSSISLQLASFKNKLLTKVIVLQSKIQ